MVSEILGKDGRKELFIYVSINKCLGIVFRLDYFVCVNIRLDLPNVCSVFL